MKKKSNSQYKSKDSHAILESESRKRKAAKIRSLAGSHTDLAKAHVLDIGTGSGHISKELGRHAKKVTSADITDERKVKTGYDFVLVDDEQLPFSDNEFDLAVSNHVAEHTPRQNVHFKELFRVIKPGGIIYLATPNKLWLTDPHYRLPLISWLPRKVSSIYLKSVRGDNWDIYPVSHFKVKKEFKNEEIHNMLPRLIRNTQDRALEESQATKILKLLPKRLDDLSKFYSPTLIYVIRKRPDANQK